MPDTHIDGETARAYAAGELSFDDIAEDRGPREATTVDKYGFEVTTTQTTVTWEEKERKRQYLANLTAEQRRKMKQAAEDDREHLKQLHYQQRALAPYDGPDGGGIAAAPKRALGVADGEVPDDPTTDEALENLESYQATPVGEKTKQPRRNQ